MYFILISYNSNSLDSFIWKHEYLYHSENSTWSENELKRYESFKLVISSSAVPKYNNLFIGTKIKRMNDNIEMNQRNE